MIERTLTIRLAVDTDNPAEADAVARHAADVAVAEVYGAHARGTGWGGPFVTQVEAGVGDRAASWTIVVDGEADDTFVAMLGCLKAGEDGYMVGLTSGTHTTYGQFRGVVDNAVVLMEMDSEFETQQGEWSMPLAAIDEIHVY